MKTPEKQSSEVNHVASGCNDRQRAQKAAVRFVLDARECLLKAYSYYAHREIALASQAIKDLAVKVDQDGIIHP